MVNLKGYKSRLEAKSKHELICTDEIEQYTAEDWMNRVNRAIELTDTLKYKFNESTSS